VKLALLFGGKSYEHEISIVSAITLKEKLSFDLEFIFCDKDKKFFNIEAKQMNSKYFASGKYKKSKELFLQNGGFFNTSLFGNNKISFDLVLNLINGEDGEDGKIASLFEFFNIPYIGPRIEASTISYNKYLTKLYAKEKKVNVLDFQLLNVDSKPKNITFPTIVKPVRAGSSMGISIAKNENELLYALDTAFEYDNEVILEPFVPNVKEYNLAGFKSKNGFEFSIIEEPQKQEMLDFDTKYLNFSRTNEVSQANLSEDIKQKMYNSFEKIYDKIFEGSLIRCDFFVIENEIYLNEINSVPGSGANYLFKDYNYCIENLSSNLPKQKNITIDYSYINKILKAK
jgi:D-alanine-D-alanine ligase